MQAVGAVLTAACHATPLTRLYRWRVFYIQSLTVFCPHGRKLKDSPAPAVGHLLPARQSPNRGSAAVHHHRRLSCRLPFLPILRPFAGRLVRWRGLLPPAVRHPVRRRCGADLHRGGKAKYIVAVEVCRGGDEVARRPPVTAGQGASRLQATATRTARRATVTTLGKSRSNKLCLHYKYVNCTIVHCWSFSFQS